MKNFEELMTELHSTMDMGIYVDRVESSGLNWKCYVGKYNNFGRSTLNATAGKTINDANETNRTISYVTHDNWFTVPQLGFESKPDDGVWRLPRIPIYFGTPKAFGLQIARSKGTSNEITFPLLWFDEVAKEEVNYDEKKSFLFIADVKAFALDIFEPQDYLHDDHDYYIIRPMRNYLDRLLKVVQTGNEVFTNIVGRPTFTNRHNFGESFLLQGKGSLSSQNIASLFTEQVSGVELNARIPIQKDLYD